jgi:hypothetical protein
MRMGVFMNIQHNLNRSQLLKILKSIRPVVMNPIMTFDMGVECEIASKHGVIYSVPGMFLFCGGNWPIKKLSPTDPGFMKEKETFSLQTSEKDTLLFTDIEEMEFAFLNIFNIDIHWEDMGDSDLMDWHEAIVSKGISFLAMSDAVE